MPSSDTTRSRRIVWLACMMAGMIGVVVALVVIFVLKGDEQQQERYSSDLVVLESVLLDHSFKDVITDIQSARDDGDHRRLYVATRSGIIHVVHLDNDHNNDNNEDDITNSNTTNVDCDEDSSTRSTTTSTAQTVPYLDISSRVYSGGERGLLGLAFHPNYSLDNDQGGGYFFVHYSNLQSNTVIARYQRKTPLALNDNNGDEDVADPDSETILKIIEQTGIQP